MPETQALIDDFDDKDKIASNLVFWDYKTEKILLGIFKKWAVDSFGEHSVLTTDEIDKETKELKEVHLPNLMALNSKLKTGEVKEGDKVKIVYLEEIKAKKSGRTYSNFDVFIKSSSD